MTESATPASSQVVACTVSRDITNFDLLVEDMEAELGSSWGDLTLETALRFLNQPEAQQLWFLALAIDQADDPDKLKAIVSRARALDIRVILVSDDTCRATLGTLLKLGADDYIPYPLPEGMLRQAIHRLQSNQSSVLPFPQRGKGVVIPIHGVAGGVGATTCAINVAWELALLSPANPISVCLLDLDIQFGSVATYLGLPRSKGIPEMLVGTNTVPTEAFLHSFVTYKDHLQVLTAPTDILPLTFLNSTDIRTAIHMARSRFDYVILDMSKSVIGWTQAALMEADAYYLLAEPDERSVQNMQRLCRTLKAEKMPFEKVRFILNRSPVWMNKQKKACVRFFSETLNLMHAGDLRDMPRTARNAACATVPLAISSPNSALRHGYKKIAGQIAALKRTTP